MLRSLRTVILAVLTCAASGCATSCCYDWMDDTLTGCHDHMEAKRAWRQCRECFCEVEFLSDFREGYLAGYVHVMNGGGCCRPTLPPRHYWSQCTRGGDSNCRIVAWYNGWSSGFAQAHHDGMGNTQMTTAAEIYNTNHPYPVELPPDLRRGSDGESDMAPLIPETPPSLEGTPPAEPPVEPGPKPLSEGTPPAAPYNPPATPLPESGTPQKLPAPARPPVPMPAQPLKDERLKDERQVSPDNVIDDALVPPAPPRLENSDS